ncbi:MAG: hypothetical protein K0Q55_1979, partial [Verrucomicrobia bacterium]|nr:hypothetical protein [Verrucomicrobiota bacterium]
MKPWHKRLLIGGMTFFLIAGATAIIVPNFIPARHTNHPSCIGYLKWIEGATGQWALENQKGDADKPVLAEV